MIRFSQNASLIAAAIMAASIGAPSYASDAPYTGRTTAFNSPSRGKSYSSHVLTRPPRHAADQTAEERFVARYMNWREAARFLMEHTPERAAELIAARHARGSLTENSPRKRRALNAIAEGIKPRALKAGAK